MLEVKTLSKTPVPDPRKVDPLVMKRLIELVQQRLRTSEATALDIEKEIDRMVADCYALTARERRALGSIE